MPRDVLSRHGLSASPTYRIWQDMLRRCRNERCEGYRNYGGRGIKVCERWQKFENFYADMGPRPDGLTLDRKDNDGNYEPGNCRWATWQEQRVNQRQRTTCRRGHAMSDDNVCIRTRADGRPFRTCRTCKRDKQRAANKRFRERHKAAPQAVVCA